MNQIRVGSLLTKKIIDEKQPVKVELEIKAEVLWRDGNKAGVLYLNGDNKGKVEWIDINGWECVGKVELEELDIDMLKTRLIAMQKPLLHVTFKRPRGTSQKRLERKKKSDEPVEVLDI